jgi:ADP-heptose:LPS heptosyltransferase
MPTEASMSRALVIQLARLGDLVQSLPAIMALKAQDQARRLDLLCAGPLASLGSCFPGIEHVHGWQGERWRAWSDRWESEPQTTVTDIRAYLHDVSPALYDRAYNLNQHCRAVLAASLLAEHGPLSQDLPPWAAYLQGVARNRGDNRIHLADAFCGLCGVRPLEVAPRLNVPTSGFPADLAPIGMGEGPWIAVVVGAGDPERCVPPPVWSHWVTEFLDNSSTGQVVLIGGGGERATAHAVLDGVPSLFLGRVWNATGRTSLVELAAVLARCQWVVGADTGPLHLGAAMGARALGFYFAHARVHETGPYGESHWVWQAEPLIGCEVRGTSAEETCPAGREIDQWPIAESVSLLLDGRYEEREEWSLWQSHLDRWGVYYGPAGLSSYSDHRREKVWRALHPMYPVKTAVS